MNNFSCTLHMRRKIISFSSVRTCSVPVWTIVVALLACCLLSMLRGLWIINPGNLRSPVTFESCNFQLWFQVCEKRFIIRLSCHLTSIFVLLRVNRRNKNNIFSFWGFSRIFALANIKFLFYHFAPFCIQNECNIIHSNWTCFQSDVCQLRSQLKTMFIHVSEGELFHQIAENLP